MTGQAEEYTGEIEVIPPTVMGRPTLYDPEFCDKVRELGAEGASQLEIAVTLGISESSWYNWRKIHPEFMEAVNDAKRLSLAWWEKQGRLMAVGLIPNANATAYIFNMKNRFRKKVSKTANKWSNMETAVPENREKSLTIQPISYLAND